MYIHDMSYNTLFTLLVWPSVWGWYMVLKLSLLSNATCNTLQKDEVNGESLSEMILQGILWSLTMSQKNTWAMSYVVYVVHNGEK